MTRLGGFEPAPRVAVGLSGGGDSVALLLLLDRWAKGQGGAALALTVDHGLRPEFGGGSRSGRSDDGGTGRRTPDFALGRG